MRDVLVGVLAGVLLVAGYLLLAVKVHPPTAGQRWGLLASAAASGGWQRGLWALIALVAPPIEEFVFRGVLWSGLRRSFGPGVAGVAVTLLFVGSHVTEALSYWPAWVAIAGLGLGTLLLRVQSRSLTPPVALHESYNCALILVAFLRGS